MTDSSPTLTTPIDVVLAAPLMLGYWPEGSVCAIFVDVDSHVVVIMRWAQDSGVAMPPAPAWPQGTTPPVGVHLVVFTSPAGPASSLHPHARHRISEALSMSGVPLARLLVVASTGDEVLWTDVEGPDGDAGVHAISRAEIERRRDDWGLPRWRASREDYVADIDSNPQVCAQVEQSLITQAPVGETQRDRAISRATSLLAAGPSGPAEVAEVLRAIADIQVRDTVLWDLMHEDPRGWATAADHLAMIVASSPDAYAAPPATLLAILRWQIGDGSRAGAAVDRALTVDPSYSLARLVDRCLATGLHPATWREGLRDLSREECRRAA